MWNYVTHSRQWVTFTEQHCVLRRFPLSCRALGPWSSSSMSFGLNLHLNDLQVFPLEPLRAHGSHRSHLPWNLLLEDVRKARGSWLVKFGVAPNFSDFPPNFSRLPTEFLPDFSGNPRNLLDPDLHKIFTFTRVFYLRNQKINFKNSSLTIHDRP